MYSLKERIIALTIVVAVFVGVAFIIRNNGKNHLPNGDHVVRITNTGERYHYASCSYLHSSSIKITIKEATDEFNKNSPGLQSFIKIFKERFLFCY